MGWWRLWRRAAVGKPGDVRESLGEVNAARSKRSLPPFERDEGLTEAAMAAALYRAQRLIEGHTPNDFEFLPEGCTADSAGCGALEPSWGWGSCCTFDDYKKAGAAWAWGSNGLRFMHIFVRR